MQPCIARVPLACALVLCAGCELVRDPASFEGTLGSVAVHGILVANDTQAAVVLSRTLVGAPGQPHELRPVAGATVRITSDVGTVTLTSTGRWEDCLTLSGADVQAMGPGCYAGTVAGGIAPGSVYELYIELPDGAGIVTGATEVPRPVTIRSPGPGATLEFDQTSFTGGPPLPVAWSDPSPGGALHLRLRVDNLDCYNVGLAEGDIVGNSLDLTGRDSANIWSYVFCWPLPSENVLDGILTFARYDASYAQHVRMRETIRLDDAANGVTGAIGVFGSVAITRLPVRVLIR